MAKEQIYQRKGIVLFLVLTTILVVTILANIVLNIMSSQSRLTHHQVSRVQANYAAQAGMVLAIENLRLGNWGTGMGPETHTLCNNYDCDVTDPSIPYPVSITISQPGSGISGTREIKITVTYPSSTE